MHLLIHSMVPQMQDVHFDLTGQEDVKDLLVLWNGPTIVISHDMKLSWACARGTDSPRRTKGCDCV